ncbi:transposase [Mycobacterium sp. smrl_JER01]|uniref:transposase n=1 Tax=Mycobacterium sp. smrl_JER01 TaxID=3402633 RepID=UPI003ACDE6A7
MRAGYGERSGDRTNHRNGYRRREFNTRAGTLDAAIPKLRHGSYFPDWLVEHRMCARAGPDHGGGYLLGVSTPRMDKLVGIFPDRGALIRLAGAVLAEQHDERAESRRSLGLDALSKSRAVQNSPTEPKVTPEALTA